MMTLTAQQVRSEALRLSPEERARLAKELISSLDEAEWEDPEAVDAAWAEEVRRRLDQFRRGEIDSVEGSKIMEELRSRFRK